MRAFVAELPAWASEHPLVGVARKVWSPDLRRALAYASVLALGLGLAVVIGANLSNAMPSAKRPFGWSGPSSFENGVAMVRFDLVLATTLPALALGARVLEGRDARTTRARDLLALAALNALVLLAAVIVAAQMGAWWTAKTPTPAFWAFVAAHALLALSFWSLGFLWAAALRRHALAASLATWGFFVIVWDSLLKVNLYREVGYFQIAAGNFPSWFWLGQALSPVSCYEGVLILWRRGFRDSVERFALDRALLPAWMNPGTFSAVIALLWIALPIACALLAWRWRREQELR